MCENHVGLEFLQSGACRRGSHSDSRLQALICVSPVVMDNRCAQRGERGTEAEATVSNPQKRWVYVLISQAFFLEDRLLALFVDN